MRYLACDLGAESGRLMLGTLSDTQVSLQPLHRFPNTPITAGPSLCWDITALFGELKAGLRKVGELKLPLMSISTDSWGVDYVLLDETGAIIPPAFHYRDPRSVLGVTRMHDLVSPAEIFAETGIQFMTLNTLYQLAAEQPERLSRADRFLMIADAFNFFLSGGAKVEESNASTTQCYNPRTHVWSKRLLEALRIPWRIMPEIVPSGTRLGILNEEIASEAGLPRIEVIAGCSHDTAAAVAAVPATSPGPDWAYISSGTWSLMGVELTAPLINEQSRRLNFTNEIGFGGSVRLLKNIIGLWMVQECRREWVRSGQGFDYATLTKLAADAPPFMALVNPSDARFVLPGDMPERIASFCRETGQVPPVNPGATIRCVLESLALLYRRTLEQLETLLGQRIERIHIVGGGSNNELLNQFTADALGRTVLAGPTEATALGNVLVQAIALGHIPSLAAAREMVRTSFPLREFQPRAHAEWTAQYERFIRLCGE